MLNMIKGCTVPDPSALFPGYEKTKTGFAANVNAEQIIPMMTDFLRQQEGPVFFVLEIPTNRRDETQGTLHKEIYYWDGMPAEYAVDFLRKNGEILVHDGMSSFGFGTHTGRNEIFLEKYNVLLIHADAPRKYVPLLEAYGLPMVTELVTAWSQFREGQWGECVLYDYNGKNIYDFVEFLKPYGLYFGGRQEI